MKRLRHMNRASTRQMARIASLLAAALLWSSSASGQVYLTFEIDPSRSQIEFASGEASARLGLGTFPVASLTAQPGTGPVPLTGHFVALISPDLSTPDNVSPVSGTTEVRVLESVLAAPAEGALPGSSPASFGLLFDDPFVGVSGELAMRDLVFAIGGFWDVFTNGAGPLGLRGDMPWLQATGDYDLVTSLGIEESIPLGFVPVFNTFLSSSTSQLREISPGVYELTLPYSFTLASFASPDPVPGPVSDLSVSARFTGEIVATSDVPEPGLSLGLAVGAGMLAGLRRLGGRRS